MEAKGCTLLSEDGSTRPKLRTIRAEKAIYILLFLCLFFSCLVRAGVPSIFRPSSVHLPHPCLAWPIFVPSSPFLSQQPHLALNMPNMYSSYPIHFWSNSIFLIYLVILHRRRYIPSNIHNHLHTTMTFVKSFVTTVGVALVGALMLGSAVSAQESCPECSSADTVLKSCNTALLMNTWPGTMVFQ